MAFRKDIEEFLKVARPDFLLCELTSLSKYRTRKGEDISRNDWLDDYADKLPELSLFYSWLGRYRGSKITRWYAETSVMTAMIDTGVVPRKSACLLGCSAFHAAVANYFLARKLFEPSDFDLICQVVSSAGFCGTRYNPFPNHGARELYELVVIHHEWINRSEPVGFMTDDHRENFRTLAMRTAKAYCRWSMPRGRRDLTDEVIICSAVAQTSSRIHDELVWKYQELLDDLSDLESQSKEAIASFRKLNPGLSESLFDNEQDPFAVLRRIALVVAGSVWIDDGEDGSSTESQSTITRGTRTSLWTRSSLSVARSKAASQISHSRVAARVSEREYGVEMCSAVLEELRTRMDER